MCVTLYVVLKVVTPCNIVGVSSLITIYGTAQRSDFSLSIHKKKFNKMQQCIKILLFHIYMKLNMFWATHRPSSGA